MTSFNQIGPWITLGILCLIVLFSCIFYISKALQAIRKPINDNPPTKNIDGLIMSKENKKKLKEEIVHDIVSDITPVLKKRIEKAF
jgi:hypothetical protein